MKLVPYLLLWQSATLTVGQLIAPVGPTTDVSEKQRECNILDYGAFNDNSTDIAQSLETAFEDCVLNHPGSTLIVPEGAYLLNRSVVLSNATNWAFRIDGLITLAYGGNYTVDRELILQGYAGVQPLNDTINGEGDGLFLQDGLVIVNGRNAFTLINKGTWHSMLTLRAAVDFEFYSSTGKGAFQGQGYIYRNSNKSVS